MALFKWRITWNYDRYVNLGLIFFHFYSMQTDSPVEFLLSNRIHNLKYLRSTKLASKDIGIENISLWQQLNSFRLSSPTEFIVWKIKTLQHQLTKIKRLENYNLFRKFSYFFFDVFIIIFTIDLFRTQR